MKPASFAFAVRILFNILLATLPIFAQGQNEGSFASLTLDQHFWAARKICCMPNVLGHPEDFELAIEHLDAILAAVPEDSEYYDLAFSFLLLVQAQRDRPEDFDSLTPQQHYIAAIYICNSSPLGCAKDYARVTAHFKAIPEGSPDFNKATRALRLLEIMRDRPSDFPAAHQADIVQCEVDIDARVKQEGGKAGCPFGVEGECDPLNASIALNPRRDMGRTR